MGTGVTLSTKPPENLKRTCALAKDYRGMNEASAFALCKKGFENRIVTARVFWSSLSACLLLESKFYGQAMGLISTGQLSAFRYTRFHTQPIDVVVYHESHWQVSS